MIHLLYFRHWKGACKGNGLLQHRALFATLSFFYKQLALGWQITKQLSWVNPLSLSNKKDYRLKKSGVFPL